MKATTLLISLGLTFGTLQKAAAQRINWESLENTRHILTADVGLEYGVTYGLGYGYQLKTKVPLVLTAHFSIPAGAALLDDFNTKIGGQIVLLNKANFRGSLAVHGLYRRYENPLVALKNFGSEIKGTIGYYQPKWFVGVELGFDKAIVTHFKHSEIYKETIYPEVKDGWYQPPTGGNFQYGLQAGYSFRQSDITLGLGRLIGEDFKSAPSIPFYMMLGYNYRIGSF
jgi:hypothetical protein